MWLSFGLLLATGSSPLPSRQSILNPVIRFHVFVFNDIFERFFAEKIRYLSLGKLRNQAPVAMPKPNVVAVIFLL